MGVPIDRKEFKKNALWFVGKYPEHQYSIYLKEGVMELSTSKLKTLLGDMTRKHRSYCKENQVKYVKEEKESSFQRRLNIRQEKLRVIEEMKQKKIEKRFAKIKAEEEEKERIKIEKQEKLKDKIKELLELNARGKNLKQIGELKGVTKERIRQLFGIAEKLGLGRYKRRANLKPKIEKFCHLCGKPSGIKKFCSKECWHKTTLTPDETRDRKRHTENCIARYHRVKNTPEYKRKLAIYMKRHKEKQALGKAVTPL